jgi:hypothetical protein
MNKFIICIAFLALIATTVSAQNRKEIEKAGVKKITETEIRYENGKEVKVVISENRYDANGREIECKEWDKKTGAFKKHEKYFYNANGDLIKMIEYDSKGKELKQTIYKYNSDGMKTSKEVYEPPGKLKSKRVYQYEK